MKLVGFNTFVRLPAGTVFAHYIPCCLEGHFFNGTMVLSPWLGDPTFLCEPGDEAPATFEIYNGSNADYMEHELFLIFDENDIDRLIKVLEWAKSGCEGPNPGSMEV